MTRITRSDARRKAFEIIFSGMSDRDGIDEQIELMMGECPEYEAHMGYISAVVKGTAQKCDELDKLIIDNLASNWSIARLSKMSRAALRLGLYEMLYAEDVPPKVAINEAVELSKAYGEENEPSFVNGVLGSVMKKELK